VREIHSGGGTADLRWARGGRRRWGLVCKKEKVEGAVCKLKNSHYSSAQLKKYPK